MRSLRINNRRVRGSWGLFLSVALLGLCASTDAATSTVCLPEDNQTCLLLSPAAAQELVKGNNAYGDDIQLHLERFPSQEVGSTLRSIQIIANTASNGQVIPAFSFQNAVQLQLGQWTLFERIISAGNPSQAASTAFVQVSDVRQWLNVYWNNGTEFVRFDGLTLNPEQSLQVTVHNAGFYQIQVAMRSSTLQLAPGSPYPRIITPNAHYNRRAFFFVDGTGQDVITGTIYDFQGAKVRDLQVDALSPAPNALVWDGRANGGNVVPSGPYYYKISSGGRNVTGGLVVAR